MEKNFTIQYALVMQPYKQCNGHLQRYSILSGWSGKWVWGIVTVYDWAQPCSFPSSQQTVPWWVSAWTCSPPILKVITSHSLPWRGEMEIYCRSGIFAGEFFHCYILPGYIFVGMTICQISLFTYLFKFIPIEKFLLLLLTFNDEI